MPTGVMSTVCSICFSLLAAKWNNRRCFVCMMACMVPIAGTAILYGVPRSAVSAQLIGLYLVYHSSSSSKTMLNITVLRLLRALRRWHLSCSGQHSRTHQKERSICHPIHWLCCWQPHWTANVPGGSGACLYWRGGRYVGVLLCMYRSHGHILGSLRDPKSWSRCTHHRGR
jgi:hypothetical protein